MTLGFVLWAILGYIIGGAFEKILPIFPLFVVLYGIFNTLGEMGPGVRINANKPYLPETNKTFRLPPFCAVRNRSLLPSEVTSSVLLQQ